MNVEPDMKAYLGKTAAVVVVIVLGFSGLAYFLFQSYSQEQGSSTHLTAAINRQAPPTITPIAGAGYPKSKVIQIVSVSANLTVEGLGLSNDSVTFYMVWKNTSNSTVYYGIACPPSLWVTGDRIDGLVGRWIQSSGGCDSLSFSHPLKPGQQVISEAPGWFSGLQNTGRIGFNFTLVWWGGVSLEDGQSVTFPQSFDVKPFPDYSSQVERCNVPSDGDCTVSFNLMKGDTLSIDISEPQNSSWPCVSAPGQCNAVGLQMTGPTGLENSFRSFYQGYEEFRFPEQKIVVTVSQGGQYALNLNNTVMYAYPPHKANLVTMAYLVTNPTVSAPNLTLGYLIGVIVAISVLLVCMALLSVRRKRTAVAHEQTSAPFAPSV